MADWEAELRRERQEKDQFFGEHPQSPLSAGRRETFDGLVYYPPDQSFRFRTPLKEFADHETITVETTQEGSRHYKRWGEFAVDIDGDTVRLTAFKADPTEEHLWVPFRDETNGETTYPAGRYLDLEPVDRPEDGEWMLDFNRAYNPFCAYSDAYECPLVPMENWIDVAIEAGEQYVEPG